MKRILIISLLSLLGCCQSAFAQMKLVPREKLDSIASPALAPDSATFVCEDMTLDAGTVKESSEPLMYEYDFTNTGGTAVTVVHLAPSCSCMTATCQKRTVAPGEKTKICLTYSPKGHVGGFTYRVFVYTDDNRQPTAILKLSVNVIPE